MLDEVTKAWVKKTLPMLNESQKRWFLAIGADLIGRGGVKELSEVSGVHRNTISSGISEINAEDFETRYVMYAENSENIRPGNQGRKSITEKYPQIEESIETIVSSETYGNPMNPLKWTTKSLRNISEELKSQDINVNHVTVGQLLEGMGYSLQANRKMLQVGTDHPDRDAQFKNINTTCLLYMEDHQPVVSIDCKKKENVGNFSNSGREWHERGKPVKTQDHDWAKEKAAPFGVYDIASFEGYVNVGISSDTAEFAVNSLREWWDHMGKIRYPEAQCLYITCDGGGSNGTRNRLWKFELQKLANELGIAIQVSHFPPGTSKWNKIEHRLFSQITKNWRNQPLDSYLTIVKLIENTTTSTGLKVGCSLDIREYLTGIKVDDETMSKLHILRDEFHGEWNYTILPDDHRFAGNENS